MTASGGRSGNDGRSQLFGGHELADLLLDEGQELGEVDARSVSNVESAQEGFWNFKAAGQLSDPGRKSWAGLHFPEEVEDDAFFYFRIVVQGHASSGIGKG